MQYLSVVLLLVLFVTSIILYKKRFHPIIIINLIFLSIMFGYTINLNHIFYDQVESACIIICIGMVCINFGSFLVEKRYLLPVGGSCKKDITNKTVRKSFVFICIFVLVIFGFLRIQEYLSLASKGYSLGMIRMFYFGSDDLLYQNTGIHRNPLLTYGNTYLYVPVLYISIVITSIFLFDYNLRKKTGKVSFAFIAATMLSIAISMITDGGRVILYEFFVVLLLTKFIIDERNKKNGKIKKKTNVFKLAFIFILLAGLFIVGRLITIERSNSGISFFDSVYRYFCGCIPNMEAKLNNYNYDYYTMGISFVSGIIRPFFTAFKFVFNTPIPQVFANSDQFLFDAQNVDFIGPKLEYNAFVTMFYCFYRDAGWLGLILESLLLGIALTLIYNRMKNYYSYKDIVLFLICMIGISISFVRWQIMSVGYGISFLYYLFAFKTEKVSDSIKTGAFNREKSIGVDVNF